MSVLSLVLGSSALAATWEAEPQDFSVESSIPLFQGQRWTSAEYGIDEVGVRVIIEPELTLTTMTEGTARMTWPTGLEVEVEGKRRSGEMRLHGKYVVKTEARVDVFGYYEFDTTIDEVEVEVDDVATFDPFDPASVRVSGSDGHSFDTDVSGIPVFGSIDVSFDTDLWGEALRWKLDGVSVSDGGSTVYPVTDEGFSQVRASVESEFWAASDFDIDVTVGVEVLGMDFDTSATILASQLFSTWEDATSKATTVRFGLPVVDAPASANGGAVSPGMEGEFTVEIENLGEGLLVGSASVEGSPAFTIVSEEVTAEPGGTDTIAIAFQPGAEGEVQGTLVLETNDPANPTVEIALVAAGVEGAGNGSGDDGSGWDGWPDDQKNDLQSSSEGGCGCASSSGPAPAWIVLGLVGLVLRRRR